MYCVIGSEEAVAPALLLFCAHSSVVFQSMRLVSK